MKPAKLALIWLVVVTAVQAQAPEPSPAVARVRGDGTETAGEALARWRQGVEVAPVLGDSECHTIHTYFNTSPESPDGRWVLLYRSTAADAHRGDICIVERATGAVRVLAREVVTEDAHRVACQQWVVKGQQVVFHDLRDEQWLVISVDVRWGTERVLARGRQLGWGQADGDVVPLYGPHWDPGEHRDLEVVNVKTGEVQTVVTADAVKKAYAEWVTRQFGDRPISVFFPILSPDRKRVFFKVSTPAGGGFRSPRGSKRYGILCYDLRQQRFLYMHPKWGHPAWHPDSRRIINMWSQGPVLVDCETGAVEKNAKLRAFAGGHPSLRPDGRLFVTDTRLESTESSRPLWGVAVGDFASGEYELVHSFDNSKGATSWRRAHPHPVFSPDGRRIYFNVSSDKWTRLYVAESSPTGSTLKVGSFPLNTSKRSIARWKPYQHGVRAIAGFDYRFHGQRVHRNDVEAVRVLTTDKGPLAVR